MNKKFDLIFFAIVVLLIFFGKSLSSFAESIPLIPSSFTNAEDASFKDGMLFPQKKKPDVGEFSTLTFKNLHFDEGKTITINLLSDDVFLGAIGIGTAKNYLIIDRGYVSLLQGKMVFNRRADNFLLPMQKLSGNIALIVKRNKKTLDFVVQYATHSLKGSFEYKKISPDAPLQLLLSPVNSKIPSFSVTSITVNTDNLPPAISAKKTPHKLVEKYRYPKDQLQKITQSLTLDTADLNVKVTSENIKKLETALLSYKDIKINLDNFQFGHFYLPYAYEWIFKKTKNIKVLNKLIDQARSVYQYRNDNMPPETRFKFSESSLGTKMYHKNPYAKTWPHYQEATVNENNEVEIVSGCAAFASLSYFTVTARVIAANRELWEQQYHGTTYKQIMYDLIDWSVSTIDYFNDVYLDTSRFVYRYPPGSAYAARVTEGIPYLYFNRYLPFMVNMIALVETYEILNIRAKQVQFIDKVISSNVKVFRSVCRYQGKNYLYYPYAASNPNKIEDFGHGSFDGNSLEILYKSGRYQFTNDMVRRIANTFNDKYIKSPGVISKWPGDKHIIHNYTYLPGMKGMIWYAHWNKGLQTNIVDYIVNTLKAKNTRIYWEVLKLRDGFYDTTGPIWGSQKAPD